MYTRSHAVGFVLAFAVAKNANAFANANAKICICNCICTCCIFDTEFATYTKLKDDEK